jgi:hemolysin III
MCDIITSQVVLNTTFGGMDMTRTKLIDRNLPKYTKGEEIFNMVTHIVGGAVGVATLVLGIIISCFKGSLTALLCSIVFGTSMIALYTVSSIYHGLHCGTAKKVFQVLDHCTIYFLIAGTYTPMLLCALMRVNVLASHVIFFIVWGLTALAVTLNAIDIKSYKTFSMLCYIGIGWSILMSIVDMHRALGSVGFFLLLGGGVVYTLGTLFYAAGKRIKYFHSVFHLFVVVGSIMHSLSVLIFAL